MLKTFLKKYGYYVLAMSLVLVVGITAGLTPKGVEKPPVIDNSQQTSTPPVEMFCPLESCEVLKWYSDTELFYNATLKQWESHKGVDLTSSKSNDVFAVLDGIVIDSNYSYESGHCITIEHADGLTSIYCSLDSADLVKKGDNVVRGQKIGKISATANNELSEGNHLHFQVKLNGKNVDPANYLTLENK